MWNTSYHITYQSPRQLDDSILATFGRVERSVSVFTPGSTVCRINDNLTDSVDALFADVYRCALTVNHDTKGYFDPTLSPLINAYGFGYKNGVEPDSAAVDSILQFVGITNTELVGNRLIKKDKRTSFNFSAIAKGFGCDCVGATLKRCGVDNYLVEVGGEIAVAGRSPSADKWHVSIDKPIFSKDKEIHISQSVIAVTDCGIATSGNYRNYHDDAQGHRIGHTVDPFTGRPAKNDMLSATVVAPSCMEADAYATALMAMGSRRARLVIQRLHLSAMIVTVNGDVWCSKGFESLIIN